MDPQELLAKISELTKEIEKLPRGYISQKAINGKVYYYHQWSENGQKKSRYLKDDELAALSVEISRRKELQAALQTEENAKRGDADAICIYAPEDRCVRY